MAKQLQLRRGTTAEHASFTGAVGEVTVDSDKDTLIVHDAYQVGGYPMLREDLNNIANQSITPAMMSITGSNPYDALMVNAAGTGVEFGSAAGRLLSLTSYTAWGTNTEFSSWSLRSRTGASYTWTKPAGCSYVLVYVTGGGGGAAVPDNNYRNAGGGAGGTAIGYYDVSGVSTVSITVGDGGTRYRGGSRAGSGSSSSFGSFCTGLGGQGGISDSPHEGGYGGGATGGQLNLLGGSGAMEHANSGTEGHGGGTSFWHKSGSKHNPDNRNHGHFGSGGSGSHYSQDNDANYHHGGAGVVVVYAYS